MKRCYFVFLPLGIVFVEARRSRKAKKKQKITMFHLKAQKYQTTPKGDELEGNKSEINY